MEGGGLGRSEVRCALVSDVTWYALFVVTVVIPMRDPRRPFLVRRLTLRYSKLNVLVVGSRVSLQVCRVEGLYHAVPAALWEVRGSGVAVVRWF